MVWAETVATESKPGRRIPLDANPAEPARAARVEGGNLLFTGGTSGDGTPMVRYVTNGPHQTHFVSCPNARAHRKGARHG